MTDRPSPSPLASLRRLSPAATLSLTAAIFACSIYANLSFAVTDGDYSFFPPFQRNVNGNQNMHLGAEYFNIARAIVAGEGFASPFGEATGPTAWMPPIMPIFLATLLWVAEGDADVVMAFMIFLQVYVLVLTGVLLLVLAKQTTRLWPGVVAALFFLGLMCNFHLWFQFTHDYWLVLLMVDLLVAGLIWLDPLDGTKPAAGWGVFGGLCALINPIVGFAWGIMTAALALQQRAWKRLGFAVLFAVLTVSPWAIRNLIAFGRLIPVKSNAAYELYQSQCVQPDGLLQDFREHPYAHNGAQRQLYKKMGEMAFIDQKRAEFWKSVWADPEDFLDRVASRFLGTLLWYEPFNRRGEPINRPVVFWLNRLVHPLPFLALLFLVFSAAWEPLQRAQWVVAGVYLLYLLPYIAVSYYERYAMPLVGVKILLLIWAVDRLLALVRRKRKGKDQEHAAERPAGAAKISDEVAVSQ